MRISKRVREEAIELLLASADTGFPGDIYMSIYSQANGYSAEARSAADSAFGCVVDCDVSIGIDSLDIDQTEKLEAASLLRDGWNPGDPVARRPSSLGKAGNE